MRRFTLGVLLCAVMFAWPAAAQEQRGSIEGVVKDAQGGVLPGATVEAKSQVTGATVSTVTDGTGAFRFPALAPGNYDVTATLAGFNTGKFDAVPVTLGQIKRLDFALAVAGVTEQVVVTAESPLVDVKQSARSTSIRSEQIDSLPRGRDYTTIITMAPGTNNEEKQSSDSRRAGIQVDGASSSENRYIVDGMEFTDPQRGTNGQARTPPDFIDEVQVKSSGYTAEYGGAVGGVVNVLTKSGTNNWRGNAFLYYNGDALEGARRPTLRLDPNNSDNAQYITYAEDSWTQYDPGFSIGGPIRRDKMWFWAGYAPSFNSRERTVTNLSTGQPTSSTEDQTQQNFSANTTSQISNNLRTRVAFNYSPYVDDGRLPALAGTDSPLALYDIRSEFPTWALSGNVDWVAKPSLYFGIRGGYWMTDQTDSNIPDESRYLFQTSNLPGTSGVPTDIPAQYQQRTGYQNVITNRAVLENKYDRVYVQGDATWYFNAGGQHTLKGGMQYDRVSNSVLDAEQQNLVRMYWGRSLTVGGVPVRGPYGYYQVRSNGVDPEKGFTVTGSINTTNVGFFVQDAWTINNRLTVNLGLRTEQERIPAYQEIEDAPEYPIEFSFGQKLAPRLGFAWDIKGDGRWKAYGSWGLFYDIFKLTLPRGSFGAERWLEYYYTLDTYAWDTLDRAGCPPACPGTLVRGPIDFRHPSTEYIDPDLDPMQLQEYSFGFEHQMSPRIALSARYVHKQVDKGIEDIGYLLPDGSEGYNIGNPGFGRASICWPDPETACPKAVRDYDGVELAFDKRFADNWSLRVAYLWSRLYGNWSGLASTDEEGRQDPNVSRAFDYPIMSFDENGKEVLGLLPTDRPHTLKAQFVYQMPWGMSVGLNQFIGSGLPISSSMPTLPVSNYPVYWLGRGDAGRTPTRSQTDIFLSQNFRLGATQQLQINFMVYNLFNQDTGTNKYNTYLNGNGITFDETEFYEGLVDFDALAATQAVRVDPRYLMDNAYQAPIAARIGVAYRF